MIACATAACVVQQLLARDARAAGVAPERIAIGPVAVDGARAEAPWRYGARTGTMTLASRLGYWWEVFPDAGLWHPPGPIDPHGGVLLCDPPHCAGYDVRLAYAANDAAPGAAVFPWLVRAPTSGEMLPPDEPDAATDAVGFFSIGVTGGAPVRFAAGSVLTIWFPFALDESLEYQLSFGALPQLHGRAFDNTLRFTLPAFVLSARARTMAEIDGEPPSD